GDFFEILHRLGEVPLPPYVHKPLRDEERYQTIFAWGKEESVAAPTAGLHFTPSLIEVLKVKGVRFAEISLSIGLDTFRPIATELVENHKIHTEYFKLGEDSAEKINNTIIEGKRVIAVGTTSVRVLETVAEKTSEHKGGYLVKPEEGWTDLFIYPGYKFKIVDTLITNFHLPRSSLLLLVCAFAEKNLIFKAYNEAIKAGYRFFSFGDAMLIL
ncbi:MAG: S-adenosylmethionine:tRNA ribosyltransferase-isomerase, partial [Candidatus Subteraquimicrobiales bacterium]|nr:S-adenosylmethionine:tRNA ribosyltransferase-isomerase [Candidatus Subteraquimicrobiales bacterium]